MKRIFLFIKEAREELRKVTWPTWDDITRSTFVVFVTVVIFTLFIFSMDNILDYIVDWFLT